MQQLGNVSALADDLRMQQDGHVDQLVQDQLQQVVVAIDLLSTLVAWSWRGGAYERAAAGAAPT